MDIKWYVTEPLFYFRLHTFHILYLFIKYGFIDDMDAKENPLTAQINTKTKKIYTLKILKHYIIEQKITTGENTKQRITTQVTK